MRGDWGNHHQKMEYQSVSCVSQFTISDMADTSFNPAPNNINTRSSKPNHASCTPGFSYALVSSISFSSSSSIDLFLIHNSAIITEYTLNISVCIGTCHDYELTPNCSIHQVQHTPSTVYTYNCLSSLHLHDYKLAPKCSFNIQHASQHRSTVTSQVFIRASKVKSPCHIPMVFI